MPDTRPRVLGQLRPANTTAASIYSPPANTYTQIDKIVICNVSGGAANIRLFLDDDGTTYDESTALIFDLPLANTDYIVIDGPFGMSNASGNLAGRTSVNSALTFTVFGRE